MKYSNTTLDGKIDNIEEYAKLMFEDWNKTAKKEEEYNCMKKAGFNITHQAQVTK